MRYCLALRFLDGVAILCITEEGWESSDKIWSRIGLVLERGRNQRFVDLNRRSGLLVPCNAKIPITETSSWGAGEASRQVWKACWCSGEIWIGMQHPHQIISVGLSNLDIVWIVKTSLSTADLKLIVPVSLESYFPGAWAIARPQSSTKRSSCWEATGVGRLGDQVHFWVRKTWLRQI